MRVQVVSDLHIEFEKGTPDPLTYITPSADILVLAGDIGSLYKYDQLLEFLRRLSPHFKSILYVAGNHEYYKQLKIQPLSFGELNARLYDLETEIDNLYILDRSCKMINDVYFVGITLWSKTPFLPPYVRISGFNTEIYNTMNERDVQYLDRTISQYKGEKLVVISHYCPSLMCKRGPTQDDYQLYVNEGLDHFFTSDQVHTWISGHIHENFDITSSGGTRLVGNQKGKGNPIAGFSKEFVIEI